MMTARSSTLAIIRSNQLAHDAARVRPRSSSPRRAWRHAPPRWRGAFRRAPMCGTRAEQLAVGRIADFGSVRRNRRAATCPPMRRVLSSSDGSVSLIICFSSCAARNCERALARELRAGRVVAAALVAVETVVGGIEVKHAVRDRRRGSSRCRSAGYMGSFSPKWYITGRRGDLSR